MIEFGVQEPIDSSIEFAKWLAKLAGGDEFGEDAKVANFVLMAMWAYEERRSDRETRIV
jgi:hypothetical protein